MSKYVILEGTSDWKEEVKRFNDYKSARSYFDSMVADYKSEGSKFLNDITGPKKEWEVELITRLETEDYIVDEETLELAFIK